MRILVADDEKIKRVTLAQDLAAQGHDVVTAGDGAEALEQLTTDRFDVLVADLKMPKIDGIDLLKRIKQDHVADVEVIIMTAYDIPLEHQAKLLRAIEEKVFERVGGATPIRANVRIIASTKRDLLQKIAAGTFRQDLYYRLDVMRVNIPPLRERREDVPLLAELGDTAQQRHAPCGAFQETIDKTERELLESALQTAGGNKSAAAAALGMKLSTFRDKLAKHGLG